MTSQTAVRGLLVAQWWRASVGQCGPVWDCSVSEHTAARQDVLATALTHQTDDRHVQLASHTSGGPH